MIRPIFTSCFFIILIALLPVNAIMTFFLLIFAVLVAVSMRLDYQFWYSEDRAHGYKR